VRRSCSKAGAGVVRCVGRSDQRGRCKHYGRA